MGEFTADLIAAQTTALKATERVLKEVRAERARQYAEWGWQTKDGEHDLVAHAHDDDHTAGDWTRFIVRHLGRGEQTIEDDRSYDWRQSMVRVAALAVAAVEAHDRAQER